MKNMKKQDENWFFWQDIARPPQDNMDVDVLLLEHASQLGKVLLRFYEWDRPSVSIGFVQKTEIVPDIEKYTVVNRPTGGGVVYHDRDFTYSVIIPNNHWIAELDRVDSYKVIHKALVRAFATLGIKGLLVDSEQPKSDRATMQCFVTPTKYDVLCDDEGTIQKCAGSAQRRTKNGILHQGSIILKPHLFEHKSLADALKIAFEQEFNISLISYNPDFLNI